MIYIVIFVFGLCFGSFVNALVWRICKQEELTEKKQKKRIKHPISHPSIPNSPKSYSILHGRSMCPNCQHTLVAKDLIPILSWLFLKGRCRYCKRPISFQYPFVELLTALLFVGSYLWWPINLAQGWQYIAFITWLAVLVGLVALAVYDAKWMILPDKILFPLIVITAVSLIFQFILGRPISDLGPITLAVFIGFGFFGAIYAVSKGKWIGFGDVKLAILLGLLVATPINMFITLFLSSLLGILWILPLMLVKKLKPTSHIPFGPFLIVACMLVVIFGSDIVDLYRNLLLI